MDSPPDPAVGDALLELLSTANRAGLHDAVRRACEVMLGQAWPQPVLQEAMNQLARLAQAIPDLIPDIAFQCITAALPPGWSLSNPSIHPNATSLRTLVRCVNYSYGPANWSVFASDGRVRSQNWMLNLADDCSIRTMHVVDDNAVRPVDPHGRVLGFEDCRPFLFQGREYAIASTREWSPQSTVWMMLLHLDEDRVTAVTPLSGDDDGHQKNWMPVIDHESLLFVQQVHPLVIREFDFQTGEAVRVRHEPTSSFCAWFRGGSPLIPFDEGYLAIIHEVTQGERSRIYVHRFVYFTKDFRPYSCTDQFWFHRHDIEFAAGLRLEGDALLVSFGVFDRAAWCGRMATSSVRQRLIPIEERTTGGPLAILQNALNRKSMPEPETMARSGIVSVTMSGDDDAGVLGDALQSVLDHVDACLVVNTGTTDAVDRVALDIAGDKAILRHVPWPNDFAQARNASLAFAAETSAAWALILDSDERMDFRGTDIGALLESIAPGVSHVSVPHTSRTYAKPRLFRLPATPQYVGETHEYIIGGTQGETIEQVVFAELPKSEAQLRYKSERDIEILTRLTSRWPAVSRWWYYLGDALQNSGAHPEAITAFRHCAETDGWDEERAWACYREAQSWMNLERADTAVEACARGLAIHPGIAELAWMAGFACWHQQQDAAAIEWSNLAIVHGEFRGRANMRQRIGFRYVPGLYESPFDVLRFAYRRLGNTVAADQAEIDYQEALAARMALLGM